MNDYWADTNFYLLLLNSSMTKPSFLLKYVVLRYRYLMKIEN